MNDKPADHWTYKTAAHLGIPVEEVTDDQVTTFVYDNLRHKLYGDCSPCAGHALQSDLDEALES